jgi:hypothetical protein
MDNYVNDLQAMVKSGIARAVEDRGAVALSREDLDLLEFGIVFSLLLHPRESTASS